MRDSVSKAAPAFNQICEGRYLWPYLDIRSLPTVAVGCLINTVELVTALPWKLPDGSLAPREVVIAQWNDLKAQTRLAKIGAKYAESVTTIRLSEADVDALTRQRVAANDIALHLHFLAFEQLNSDAQCAIHSMAFAMGSNFVAKFPKFTRAVNARDWATALAECTIDEMNNAGVGKRNRQNRVCLSNALAVQYDGDHAGRARGTHLYSADTLYWPRQLPSPASAI